MNRSGALVSNFAPLAAALSLLAAAALLAPAALPAEDTAADSQKHAGAAEAQGAGAQEAGAPEAASGEGSQRGAAEAASKDLGGQGAAADEGAPSVEEIVDRANLVSYYQGADGRADVEMTITDARGRERSREFTILRWDRPAPDSEKPKSEQTHTGEQKFYVYFHRPADVNKMVYMVWKHLDSDDDRWLYLPALDLVKRVASTDRRSSFVGSHFVYEDVSGRHTDADEHELIDTTDDYFVLRNTPKRPEEADFAYFDMWIHRGSFLVVRTKYYDRSGRSYRTYTAEKVETIDGYPTVVKSSMADEKMGGKTVMTYSDVDYNLDVPEDVFSERYLRRPPFEYLR